MWPPPVGRVHGKPPSSPLKLDDPAALPDFLRAALQQHASLFKAAQSIEAIVHSPEIAPIARALKEHLRRQRIHGYHCTREPEPGYFLANGLRPTDIIGHQDEFLAKYGHHFTVEEVQEMQAAWRGYFVDSQQRSREGKVCFCLSRSLVLSSGTEPFFRAFGGEAIYMPLQRGSSVWEKLAKLGQAVVVEAALPGDAIQSFYDMAWCVLSHYHRTVNTSARYFESEAHLRGGVPAQDILCVTPREAFDA